MNAAAAPSARASRRPSIDAQSGLTCRVLGPHRCWHQQQPDLCQETVGLVGRAACCSDGMMGRASSDKKNAGRDATPSEMHVGVFVLGSSRGKQTNQDISPLRRTVFEHERKITRDSP